MYSTRIDGGGVYHEYPPISFKMVPIFITETIQNVPYSNSILTHS